MKPASFFRSLSAFKIEFEGRTKPYTWLADMQANLDEDDERFNVFVARDPEGSTETDTAGFTLAHNFESYFTDVQGAGMIFFVRFAKRAVPAKVIAKRVRELIDAHIDWTGKKPNKAERSDMKEQAITELLPRAFVQESVVPVILTNDNWLFIFSTGQGRIETILSLVLAFFAEYNQSLVIKAPLLQRSLPNYMTSLTLGQGEDFHATDFAVMKGVDARTIGVRNYDLGYSTVRDMLANGFRVEQVGLRHESSQITFRLGANLGLTQIDFPDGVLLELSQNASDRDAEMIGVAWLAVTEYRQLLVDLVADINATPDEVVEEEDEL